MCPIKKNNKNKHNNREAQFLGGRRSRYEEFTRLISIVFEFIHGFRKLHFVKACTYKN